VLFLNYVKFTDSEKIVMFDKIASHFYEANFGQTLKADMELIMFNFYIKNDKRQSRTRWYNRL